MPLKFCTHYFVSQLGILVKNEVEKVSFLNSIKQV